jgi:uncharacterized protein YbcI
MAPERDSASRPDGTQQAAISRAIVGLMAESTGRGPTQARTTIDHDLVVVILRDTLTAGERYLSDNGHEQQVLDTRSAYQDSMRTSCISAIEGITGRTVIAFMSANHVAPDLGAEVFVLEPAR